MKKTTEELLEASHKLAQAAYGQAGEPGQAAAAAGGGDQAATGGDDVVEGEVVDEGDAS